MRPRNSKGKRDSSKSGRSGSKPKRFSKEGDKPYKGKKSSSEGEGERRDKPFKKSPEYNRQRPASKKNDRGEDKPFKKYRSEEREGGREERPRAKREGFKKDNDEGEKPYGGRERRPSSDDKKSYSGDRRSGRSFDKPREDKPYWKKEGFDRDKKESGSEDRRGGFGDREKRSFLDEKKFDSKDERGSDDQRKKSKYGDEKRTGKKKGYEGRKRKKEPLFPSETGLTRLNKFLANSGICSRREADDLIKSGVVSVNGKPVTEMGYKVSMTDEVKYNGESMKKERMVYVLLNKPKDFITTLDDPRGRKTVLELVRKAGRERIYPVGRLDRNTTGVLLMTNDGELTARLTHPKYGVKKTYHVSLDKNFKTADFEKLTEGITLDDGFIKPDVISFVGDGADKRDVGVEIHSGKNRIVRRMFEHLGYEVIKLDRVLFAGLTKKDLPRGRWRFLNDKEVAFLKMTPK